MDGAGAGDGGAFEAPGVGGASEDRGLLDAVHDNLAGYMRLLASSPGCELEEGPGYLAFAGAHEYPGTYTNGVIRTVGPSGSAPLSPAELLARADAFFGRLGRGYVVWLRTHADQDLDAEVVRRGFEVREPAEGSPATLRENSELVVVEPAGVEIAETHDEVDRRDYLQLVASVYGLPGADPALAEGVLFSLDSLRHPDSHVYLARLSDTGRLCGGTTTFLVGGAAHSAWTVADSSVRGRGVGSALVHHSIGAAYGLGAAFGWGVSSQMGAPIWNQLGYRTVTHYKRYLAPVPPAHAGATRSGARAPRRRSARPVAEAGPDG